MGSQNTKLLQYNPVAQAEPAEQVAKAEPAEPVAQAKPAEPAEPVAQAEPAEQVGKNPFFVDKPKTSIFLFIIMFSLQVIILKYIGNYLWNTTVRKLFPGLGDASNSDILKLVFFIRLFK